MNNNQQFEKVRKHAMGVEAYTAAEILQGAKSGQWVGPNQKNGAMFNPGSRGGAIPTSGSPTRPTASAPVASATANAGPAKRGQYCSSLLSGPGPGGKP